MKQKNRISSPSKDVEIVERLISVNRVTKTVKGGKKMSFTVLVVVGNKLGGVGYGKGNAAEVTDAKTKAFEAARRNMIKISLKESRTIHHDLTARFCAAKVHLRSAPSGTGVIAGGPMRALFECAGIHDIVAKSIGTSNPYNLVAATFIALKTLLSPKILSELRSKDVSSIIKKRNMILGIDNNINKNNTSKDEEK
ncbi:30S ribosomal protein S5 [Rickettsiales bacterium]|jgi:small subunit ribosomal protein S5|nr:30S ribosomal protein S5 [Rickettsiales bacterium]